MSALRMQAIVRTPVVVLLISLSRLDAAQEVHSHSVWADHVDLGLVLDQQQIKEGVLGGTTLGQVFTPTADWLERLDVITKNRTDRTPGTISIRPWLGDGTKTVDQAPLWQDDLDLSGQDAPVLRHYFPRIRLAPGRPYYLECSRPGEAFYLAGVKEDAYPGGTAVGDRRPRRDWDLWFRTFTRDPGAGRRAAEPRPLPRPSSVRPTPPRERRPVTKAVYLDTIRRMLERSAPAWRRNPGRNAQRFLLYNGFLLKATGGSRWSGEVSTFIKGAETYYFRAEPKLVPTFRFISQFAHGLKWLKEANATSPDDEKTARRVLLEIGRRSWHERERGAMNRAAFKGFGYQILAELYPDVPEARQWRDFAEAVWHDWADACDTDEDTTHYNAVWLDAVLPWLRWRGQADLLSDSRMRRFVDRFRDVLTPQGALPSWGDSLMLGADWGAFVAAFEMAATVTRDATYKWAAHQVLEHHRRYVLDDTPLLCAYEDHPNLVWAYLEADDTLEPKAPPMASRLLTATHARLVPKRGRLLELQFDLARLKAFGMTVSALQEQLAASLPAVVDLGPDDSNQRHIMRLPARCVDPQRLHDLSLAVPGGAIVPLRSLAAVHLIEAKRLPLAVETVRDALVVAIDLNRLRAYGLTAADVRRALAARKTQVGVEASTDGGLRYVLPVDRSIQEVANMTVVDKAGVPVCLRDVAVVRRGPASGILEVPRGYPSTLELQDRQSPWKLVTRAGTSEGAWYGLWGLRPWGGHGHADAPALICLVADGTVLTHDTSYHDKRVEDHNMLYGIRVRGGTLGHEKEETRVVRFADTPELTYADIEWHDYPGWGVRFRREILFVKGLGWWVRDRTDAAEPAEWYLGPIWHVDRLRARGSTWFDADYPAPNSFQWPLANGDGRLLVYFTPKADAAVDHADFTHQVRTSAKGQPLPWYSSLPWAVYQMAGPLEFGPGRQVHFNSLLIPLKRSQSAAETAERIAVVDDQPGATVLRIRRGPVTWTLALQNDGRRRKIGPVATDAVAVIVRATPGATPVVGVVERGGEGSDSR